MATNTKKRELTIKQGRWVKNGSGDPVKIFSTRAGATNPIVAGLYNTKKQRFVSIDRFSKRGVIEGGTKLGPLNIVAPTVAPKEFTALEKPVTFNVTLY